jgi:hypothetical protein
MVPDGCRFPRFGWESNGPKDSTELHAEDCPHEDDGGHCASTDLTVGMGEKAGAIGRTGGWHPADSGWRQRDPRMRTARCTRFWTVDIYSP